MLNIERVDKELKAIKYTEIPAGSVFIFKGDIERDVKDCLLFLKCKDECSVMLTKNVGQIESSDEFDRHSPLWVVLETSMLVKY